MGVGFSYTPATYTAISWFPDKRGLASGLCMACNGGSASFLAPICANLVNVIGVEMAMILIGIILGGIILICSVSGFQQAPEGYVPAGYVPPASIGDETQLESWPAARAMKSRAFWQIALCLAAMPILYVVAYPRFTLFMTNAGIDTSYATMGVTVYAIANVAGRLGLGRLIDKTSYKFTYIWCTMFSILASLVMMPIPWGSSIWLTPCWASALAPPTAFILSTSPRALGPSMEGAFTALACGLI